MDFKSMLTNLAESDKKSPKTISTIYVLWSNDTNSFYRDHWTKGNPVKVYMSKKDADNAANNIKNSKGGPTDPTAQDIKVLSFSN